MSDAYMHKYKYLYSKYKNKYIALRDSMDELTGSGEEPVVVFENRYGTTGSYTLTPEQAKNLYAYVSQPNTFVIGSTNVAQIIKNEMESAGITMANIGTRKFVVGTMLSMLYRLIDRKYGRPDIDYEATGRMGNPPRFG